MRFPRKEPSSGQLSGGATRAARKCPGLKEFSRFAEDCGFPSGPVLVKRCWQYYKKRDWTFPNGDAVSPHQWLTILRAWERNANSRRFPPQDPWEPTPVHPEFPKKQRGSR